MTQKSSMLSDARIRALGVIVLFVLLAVLDTTLIAWKFPNAKESFALDMGGRFLTMKFEHAWIFFPLCSVLFPLPALLIYGVFREMIIPAYNARPMFPDGWQALVKFLRAWLWKIAILAGILGLNQLFSELIAKELEKWKYVGVVMKAFDSIGLEPTFEFRFLSHDEHPPVLKMEISLMATLFIFIWMCWVVRQRQPKAA